MKAKYAGKDILPELIQGLTPHESTNLKEQTIIPLNTASATTLATPTSSSSLQYLQKHPLWVWCG
jgi:hypothetical protein